jgi:N-acetylglucosaminyl-diphospho-decaprenol L-rhamnosyltransferase
MSKTESYDISLVLVNWHTEELVTRLIKELCDNPPEISWELIVWDNSDSSIRQQEKTFDNLPVTWLRSKSNIGFGAGINKAFHQSRGKIIMIMNPDILPLPGSMEKLVSFISSNPESVVVPMLLNNKMLPFASLRPFPGFFTLIAENPVFHSFRFIKSRINSWKIFVPPDSGIQEIDAQPMGACIVMHRDLFLQLGGFDEDYFLFFEDVDLFYRLKKAGKKVFMDTGAKVIHDGGASIGKAAGADIQFYKSFVMFFRKHFGITGTVKARFQLLIAGILIIPVGVYRFLSGKKDGSFSTGLNMILAAAGLPIAPGITAKNG